MPVHNWKGIADGVFHDLHCSWIAEIKRALNAGLLPSNFEARAEQRARMIAPDVLTLEFNGGADEEDGGTVVMAPPKTTLRKNFDVLAYVNRQNSLVIRHSSDETIVAILEVVSRGNKAGSANFGTFMEKVSGCLKQGIHFTYVDVHPPGLLDPAGIHGELCLEQGEDPPELAPGKILSAAAYEAGNLVRGYVNPFAVGDVIPDTPMFLRENFYVMLPLEETYMRAFESFSLRTQQSIESNSK